MSNLIAISEAAAIGLHSMALIWRSKKIMNVSEITEKIGSSKHHTAKIMQRLLKKGFVSSLRGPNGGYYLKKNVQDISLLDIYEAVESKIEVHACLALKDACPFGDCLLGDLSSKMSAEVLEYLRSRKLSDYN
jgi:Rrf2 family protein